MNYKNGILSFVIALLSFSGEAQNYMNYFADNYAGVQATLQNPASIADSRYRMDINIASFSGAASNDAVGISVWELSKSSYDIERDAIKTYTTNNNAIGYVDVMGPAAMFNITPKHTVAVYTRARSVGNVNGLDGIMVDQMRNEGAKLQDFSSNLSPNVVAHVWGELGFSYATILRNKKDRFLKGGVTFKYLQAGASAYANMSGTKSVFNNTGDPKTSNINLQSTLVVGGIPTTGDKEPDFRLWAKGMGFDLGVVYEIRPDWERYKVKRIVKENNDYRYLNKYKYRFGASITDIGFMSYSNYRKEVYNINGTYTMDQINNTVDLAALFGAPVVTYEDLITTLPTAMHLDADWHIDRKIYLNFNANVGLKDRYAMNSSTTTNYFILSPRVETRYFTFMLPINYMQYSGLQMGGGIRLGPFFIGSSSVLRNWLSKNSRAADIYFGFKVPLYQTRLKKIFSKACNCEKPVYDWDK